MLMIFPEVLFLSPLVGTLLRITVALSLLYIAYTILQRRDEIGQMQFPIIGAPGSWLAMLSALLTSIIGLGLFMGYATQIFALLAFIVCSKHFVFAKRYPRAIPLCRVDYFYLMIMCVCLFLMGAGAYAFDLSL